MWHLRGSRLPQSWPRRVFTWSVSCWPWSSCRSCWIRSGPCALSTSCAARWPLSFRTEPSCFGFPKELRHAVAYRTRPNGCAIRQARQSLPFGTAPQRLSFRRSETQRLCGERTYAASGTVGLCSEYRCGMTARDRSANLRKRREATYPAELLAIERMRRGQARHWRDYLERAIARRN